MKYCAEFIWKAYKMEDQVKEFFKCGVCNIPCKSFLGLQHHLKVHSSDKLFFCQNCGKPFKVESECHEHQQEHGAPTSKPFTCGICFKRFKFEDLLKQHMASHGKAELRQCRTCGFKVNSVNLVEHLKQHSKKRYICEVCGKAYISDKRLQIHFRLHTGEKPFQCNTCEKAFRSEECLVAHERIHSGETPYKCLTCGKEFRLYSTFTDHKRFHHGNSKTYECNLCGLKFKRFSALNNHRKLVMCDSRKPYLCEFCGKRFKKISSFQAHQQEHLRAKTSSRKMKTSVLNVITVTPV